MIMKTKLTLLSAVLIALASTVHAQTQTVPEPSKWLRYTVKDEAFSLTLPAIPAMTTNKVFVERLQKRRLERSLLLNVDGVLYSVYAYENPKPRQSLDEFIAEQRATIVLGQVTERAVTAGSFSGKEYSSQGGAKQVTEQFFATEGRFYRFVVEGATPDDAGARQFFSSIMLGRKQDGIKVSDGPGEIFASNTGEKPYVGKQVETKARILKKPQPSYSIEGKKNQVTGTVILKCVFSADGTVNRIRVVQGLPYGLTEMAIEAAKKIKFIPATRDGRNVSMWMQLEYNFNLY